jgi:hypothetical protein
MFAQMATTAAGVAVGSAVGHTIGAGITVSRLLSPFRTFYFHTLRPSSLAATIYYCVPEKKVQ